MCSSYLFLVSDSKKFSFALGNTDNATVIPVLILCCISHGKHISEVFINFIPWLNFYEDQLLRISGFSNHFLVCTVVLGLRGKVLVLGRLQRWLL